MADTPSGSKSKISSSLRDRLKRCGRYHSSPIAPKPLRHDLVSSAFVTPDKSLFVERRHTDSIDLSMPKLDSDKPIKLTGESEKVKLNDANHPLEDSAERRNVDSLFAAGENCVVKKVLDGTPTMLTTKRTHDNISTDSPLSCGASKKSRHLGLNRTPVNRTPVNSNRKTLLPTKFQQKLFKTPDSSKKYADSLPTTPDTLPSTPDSVCQRDTDASGGKVGLDGVADLIVGENLCFAETANRKPIANNCSPQISSTLRNRHAILTAELTTKTDVRRKLNLVKMYRSKNNLDELQGLIDKWRRVSQEAIQDLYSRARDPKPTLQDFIASLQLCPKLLQFNAEEDSFD